MNIKKEVPNWYIVSDTKLNTNTLQRYLTDTHQDLFEEKWIRNNGKAIQVSSMEKSLEFLGSEFLGLKNEKNLACQNFIQENFQDLKMLFNHFSITVMFKNISHNFLTELLLVKFNNIHVNKKELSDLSLWFPPVCENNQKLQYHFGHYAGEIVAKIDEFIKAGKELNADEKKLIKTTLTLLPLAQQCNLVVSGTISTWREIILCLTNFNCDDETKYILMNLCRDFKIRYFSFFQDIVAETETGQQLGLDSMTANELIWKELKLNILRR